jgi:hypothetical protein
MEEAIVDDLIDTIVQYPAYKEKKNVPKAE